VSLGGEIGFSHDSYSIAVGVGQPDGSFFFLNGRVIPQFAAKAYVHVKIVFIDFCTTVYLFLRLLLHPKVVFMLKCNLIQRHPDRLKEGNV
jgi:hypothetical protein